MNMLINFGKHKGEHTFEIWESDRDYCNWARLNAGSDKEEVREWNHLADHERDLKEAELYYQNRPNLAWKYVNRMIDRGEMTEKQGERLMVVYNSLNGGE